MKQFTHIFTLNFLKVLNIGIQPINPVEYPDALKTWSFFIIYLVTKPELTVFTQPWHEVEWDNSTDWSQLVWFIVHFILEVSVC